MARKLRVYGWTGHAHTEHERRVATVMQSHHMQLRCIVAAPSAAAAARLAGYDRPRQMFNLCDTGNTMEVEAALAKPGQVLIISLNIGRHTVADYEVSQRDFS